jgi:DNA-binding response OmpR family regulator
MTNVLIVDDDALIRRFLRAGFELHGYTVLEAKDARGGLKAARSNAIDLIILDLELPDQTATYFFNSLLGQLLQCFADFISYFGGSVRIESPVRY